MQATIYWSGINLKWAYSELLSSISYKIPCKQRAKDILHDAFLRFAVSNNPHRYECPHAYLRGIVAHLIVDEHRDSAHFIPHQPEVYLECDFAHSPEHLTDIKQRLFQLQRIIDHLPPRCRKVFWLFHVEEISHKNIAAMLNISVNMVERHIIRAMLDLRAAKESLN